VDNGYERETEAVEAVRLKPLCSAAGNLALMHACHMRFSELGRIAEIGDRYIWQPVDGLRVRALSR
jgi:hypothetical protein